MTKFYLIDSNVEIYITKDNKRQSPADSQFSLNVVINNKDFKKGNKTISKKLLSELIEFLDHESTRK